MSKFIVRGGKRLTGTVKVSGAKNSVLPIIAASLLGQEGESIISDAPPLDDVMTINKVLESLGAGITYRDEVIRVNAQNLTSSEAPYEWVSKMRASFLVMGPLLARLGETRISMPGGCAIGTRPIDQHLKGFEAMGAKVTLGEGYVEAKSDGRLRGAKIYLDFASVGATENIMMAATMAIGTTTIENAAKEPEIVDLANYLNAMGAVVRGAGTDTIRIEGVDKLVGAPHTVIPDRIEAGTYMVAAAITGGDVYVEGAIADHLGPVVAKMEEMGVTVIPDENGIRVIADKPLRAVDIKTLPYPGFPTDMQSQMMALLLSSTGTSVVTETVFENRFMHVDQFRLMNAEIKVEGRSSFVSGETKFVGAKVTATDLRAGAALICAGLVAEGTTEVGGTHHIDRGYVNLTEKLVGLGADIWRVSMPEPAASTEAAAAETPARTEAPAFNVQPTWA
ncbi:UDP-N-acetylglucosamine 1-carboxyvinyltransferase [Saccharibacillus endophyticus]|uniref:UDP-N-acetylglucosamine 1-carboxyvinyltransferase n=1 Tax=Saccharibacillus endophyticus TaxID=2060666 RepID=A0ABQ2A9L2_9BACL|nr:UDP-N-acetylglucosamine 1-carboxyvinyltransferase [Saccharibacillus endophyticus]GGH86868.1 UDP-N-acetylglucosamine 1-carboxyvinyltransferase 1 [Saccharibacillus endophyticus]